MQKLMQKDQNKLKQTKEFKVRLINNATKRTASH